MGKDKAKGKEKDKAKDKTAAQAAADPLSVFDIDNPVLAPEIADRALSSGGYPYDKKLKKKDYEAELEKLQVELVKVQAWVRETGRRLVLVFEGRDSAGKGGTIFVVRQYMNPRYARIVALTKPTETELGQWYFQRYVDEMPTRGEIVLFDRSWYNRAGVEPVMGFCTPEENVAFLAQTPTFEKMLVDDGIILFKFWLNIGREAQLERFHERRHNPLKTWKLSPIDIAALSKWDAYSEARDRMMPLTDTDWAPWTVVRANDQKRARLEVIRFLLQTLDYPDKDEAVAIPPDPKILGSGLDFIAGA
ncbi:MAG TPA: polyphosphate kinase 2 [Kaistiaceae bacterium]|nr:polyphosphate kinase 2 [Kaistiaceae bacterium]